MNASRELETENAELRKRLGEPVNPVPSASNAMQNLSLQEKMDLFCSLFKGRDDVFARRWYSKTSGKPAISLYAKMNGLRYVINASTSVPTNCSKPTSLNPFHLLHPPPYSDVGNVGQVFYLRIGKTDAQ